MRLAEDFRFELAVEVFLARLAAEHALFGREDGAVERLLTDTLPLLAEVVCRTAILVVALGAVGAVLAVGLCCQRRCLVLLFDHGPVDDFLQWSVVRLFAGRQKTGYDRQDTESLIHGLSP